MSKSIASGKRGQRISPKAVMASIERYRAMLSDGRDMAPWDQLVNSPLAQRLRKAAAENNALLVQLLIGHLFLALGIDSPPEGVFAPLPKMGKVGAPIKPGNYEIFREWLNLGCPSVYRNNLARHVYGPKFANADSIDKKKMLDACRQAVIRVRQSLMQSPGLALAFHKS